MALYAENYERYDRDVFRGDRHSTPHKTHLGPISLDRYSSLIRESDHLRQSILQKRLNSHRDSAFNGCANVFFSGKYSGQFGDLANRLKRGRAGERSELRGKCSCGCKDKIRACARARSFCKGSASSIGSSRTIDLQMRESREFSRPMEPARTANIHFNIQEYPSTNCQTSFSDQVDKAIDNALGRPSLLSKSRLIRPSTTIPSMADSALSLFAGRHKIGSSQVAHPYGYQLSATKRAIPDHHIPCQRSAKAQGSVPAFLSSHKPRDNPLSIKNRLEGLHYRLMQPSLH